MTPEQEGIRLPELGAIVAILTVPPSAGLFPIGDCNEQEFRELLCTSSACPISWEVRPVLVSSPSETVRERLPGLVQAMRTERLALREKRAGLSGILHGNLALAYQKLAERCPLPFLARAITWYEDLLGILARGTFPAEWATTQNNLGSAYFLLPGGDRRENLERAIACYRQALLVRTRGAFPADWARTQNNLGSAYQELPGGDRRQNLERAIACYQQALEVYTREAFPAERAMTQNNLGVAYFHLPGGDRRRNLEQAIACFQQALEVYTHEAFPADWARTQNNLGSAYSGLPAGDRQRNLERAIACYRQTLEVCTREAFPADWAGTQKNLGSAYSDLPEGGLRAIEVWLEVLNHFHDIIHASLEPLHLAAQAADLVRRVIPLLVEVERTADLVGVLEQGRAIGLRLELTRTNRTPAGLTDSEQCEYRQLSDAARDVPSARRRLDALPLQATNRAAALVELGQRFKKVLARLQELERRDPAFPLAPLPYPRLRQLAVEQSLTLVYLQPTNDRRLGAVSVVIHPGSPPDAPSRADVVSLPGLSREQITDRLFRIPIGLSFTAEHFQSLLAAGQHGGQLGWVPAYLLKEFAVDPYQQDAAREVWHGTIRSVVDQLGPALAPLIGRLRQAHANRVVLLPGGRLPLLPLHAVPVPGAQGGAECFGEEFVVSYAPSAASLSLSLERAKGTRSLQPGLTAIANPDGSLPFADEEVLAVASRFGGNAQVARGKGATRAWLDPRAAQAGFLELATHASFRLDAPSASRLALAPGPGDGLSLDDLWGGRFRIREGCVVTASACETAQIDLRDESDESLGFPAAFLGLGASSVVGSLWAVNDLSTALLMNKVYELLLQSGCSPAAAVQQASHWLRTLPREDVRRWLEARRAAAAEALAAFNVHQGGPLAERLAVRRGLEERQELLGAALGRLQGRPDPPFATRPSGRPSPLTAPERGTYPRPSSNSLPLPLRGLLQSTTELAPRRARDQRSGIAAGGCSCRQNLDTSPACRRPPTKAGFTAASSTSAPTPRASEGRVPIGNSRSLPSKMYPAPGTLPGVATAPSLISSCPLCRPASMSPSVMSFAPVSPSRGTSAVAGSSS
jgi:CHAT domain-containing protein/tetratricopeptide (TPR) repeat protein